MLYSVSSHSTFGHFLNIFGHQGIKKKIPHPALANNVSVHRTISVSASTSSANRARGGLPRFYSEQLPASKDKIVRMEGEESWHMTRVLRLCVTDRVELFNGRGEIVGGQIMKVDRSGVYIVAVEDPVALTPSGVQWHVVAAFGTLKGGRADWLVEKSTELGASSITPLLTERSTLITASSLTFLAMAEATPLVDALSVVDKKAGGLLLVGPEGDFTDKEVEALTKAGAIPVGLGPRRLRVETATITLLAGAMLWTDVQHVGS